VFINSQVTRQVQLTDARATLLTAVTTSYSTIIIDYTHSVKAIATVADDVLTSGQLYGMPWLVNV